MSDLVVLVPNWARLAPDMQAETGHQYSSFIPLGGAPLYKRIISQYRCDGHRVRMVFLLAPDAPALEIDLSESTSVEVVRPEESASIGQTVLAGLTKITASDSIVVHMADTLLDLEGMPLGDGSMCSRAATFTVGRVSPLMPRARKNHEGSRGDRARAGPGWSASACFRSRMASVWPLSWPER